MGKMYLRTAAFVALCSIPCACNTTNPHGAAAAMASVPSVGSTTKPGVAPPRGVGPQVDAMHYFCARTVKTWGSGADTPGYRYTGNRRERGDGGTCVKIAGNDPPAPSGEVGKLVGITAAHNEVRAAVGVAAMSWSNELGAHAQAWANHLASNGCNLAHRPSDADTYGENLFWRSNGSTASGVVAQWASEKASYDHGSNSCSGDTCGHYTQVVWAASTKVGCGMAACGSAEVWVCNYDPQGNVLGQSPY